MRNSSPKRSGMARVNHDHTVLPANGMSHSLSRASLHFWSVLIFRPAEPAEGRRLSWPEWLVTSRGARFTARRRSPIRVLTGPGVE